MSALTTTLAWLIPCIVLLFVFIAWRVYAYKTHRSVLPSSLQRNIFARTLSFVPKPVNEDQAVPVGTVPLPSAPIRNETVIIIPAPTTESEKTTQGQAPSIPSGPSPAITRLINMK
ncbi:hypothetical protein BGZ52_006977 [Haplosporangium bisporale]|nr:hypothetical protein BGZ52_006977 [Haplosporangium bisporale]KAF9214233.1 hypothetical protein BGZ59_004089 [Podila verticillata]